MVLEMFCQDCKHNVSVEDPKPVTLKTGQKVWVGKCPDCGSELMKRRE